jgi:hypothetical protein
VVVQRRYLSAESMTLVLGGPSDRPSEVDEELACLAA